MAKQRIYIAGCGGMLGEAFHLRFLNQRLRCTDKDVNEPWLSYLDFRDRDAYYRDVRMYKPDWLFHLGALTDLEYCEKNPDDAYRSNTLAVEDAVSIANTQKIPLLYISTAGIFDGKKPLYDDWDQPHPLGVYARTKYMGERFVVENSRFGYLICRAGWMMGGGPKKDKKFIQKIMQQIKGGAEQLYVVNDKDGTPTYTHDFARTVQYLIDNGYRGVFNCVCKGETSRLEVTRAILKITGQEEKIRINEVSSFYFKDIYSAPRPPSERLIGRKLQLRGIDLMRPWQEALREYIKVDYRGYRSLNGEPK